MKKNTKWLIGLSIAVVCLLSFIVGNTIMLFNYKNDSNLKKENNSKVVDSKDTNNTEDNSLNNPGSSINNSKEVTVEVGKGINLPFYILREDENSYTLIAKDSLGKSEYFKSETCNADNQEGCNGRKVTANVDAFLVSATKEWNYVGNKRIPSKQDIAAAPILPEYSFWLKNDITTIELDAEYYNNKEEMATTDKIFTSYDVVPVIEIIKSYVRFN